MGIPFRSVWSGKPEKIQLKIEELSQEEAKSGDRHRWRVRISLQQATREVSQWERVIEDPFDKPGRHEIQEYFDIVTKPDEIDDEDASKTSCKLDEYRKLLFESLQIREHLPCCHDREVEVWIREMDASGRQPRSTTSHTRRSIQSLHWEHLEDIALWSENNWGFQTGPTSVTVQRIFQSPRKSRTTTANAFGPIRILLVIARKHIHENEHFDFVSPTSVLCSILKAQHEIERRSYTNRIQLEVVRPGTFEEFEASLLRCGRRGKHHAFQIVHFDVHGDISPTNRTAFLEFNQYDPNGRKLQSKPFGPQKIAEQLLKHGVDCVVLSSCKTAVADAGVEANLSRNLLKRGVASVVAMSYNVPDSMSKVFFSRFYQEVIVDGREMAHAVAVARKELRQNQGRWSYENQRRVDLQDWFVPKYYSDGQPMRINSSFANRLWGDIPFFVSWTLILGLICPLLYASWASTNGPNTSGVITACVFVLGIYKGHWWSQSRGLRILQSVDHDRKNILRLEGDLRRCHKVFLNAWNDAEATAPTLVTALSEIWRRTHLVEHRIVIQADWFIHPLDVDTQDWRILLASCARLLRLWSLESSKGLQSITRENGSDEAGAERRTVVIIENVNALFPEDIHRKVYHDLAQKRFYDWVERYFGTEPTGNTSQNPNYLILIGNFVQETLEDWFRGTLGTSSVLASSILTEYISPKQFPHRTEGVAMGRSWLG